MLMCKLFGFGAFNCVCGDLRIVALSGLVWVGVMQVLRFSGC